MATMTVRALDEETKKRLRIRAAQNGHSMEQEARDILRAALAVPATEPVPPEHWVDQILRQVRESGGGFELEIPPREVIQPRVVFDE